MRRPGLVRHAGVRPAAGEGTSPGLTTAAATISIVVSIMPAFLTGASSVLLSRDLGIHPTDLGYAFGAFFAASAVAASVGGRLADRWGSRRSLVQAILLSTLVLAGLGAFASDLRQLMIGMALGGLANGLAVPAGALALHQGVVRRKALMFGVVQSAIPAATLFAGATVPLLGVRTGWRWAYVIAALMALGSLWLPLCIKAEASSRAAAVRRGGGPSMTRTVPLAVAMGVGAGAATAIPIFLLPAAVAAGISVSNGGWLLAGGSVAAIMARLGSGWYADRMGGTGLNIIWLMMVLGCAGCGLLALDGALWLVVGAVIAYACGFGWTGLLNFATVLLNPNAPASAAGLVQSGGAGGAALAPVVFGLIVEGHSYTAGWLAIGGALLLSSFLILFLAAVLAREEAIPVSEAAA